MLSVHFSAVFYELPQVQHTPSKNARLLSATTSFLWRHTNTCKNQGYNAAGDDSCTGSHLLSWNRHALSTKKGKKVEKGQTFWVHTYPMVSSRPRGRYVQSLVQIGSEMWICIRYKQTKANTTNKQTNKKKLSVLYIRFQSISHKKNTVSITKAKKLIIFKKRSFSSYKTYEYLVGKMRRF